MEKSSSLFQFFGARPFVLRQKKNITKRGVLSLLKTD